MSRPVRSLLAAALGACAALAPGCASDPSRGYAFSSPYRDDVRSVAVPVFGNTTFEHGLEMRLTEAVQKEIARTTPWAVSSTGRADTTLAATIVEVDRRKLSTDQTSGLVQELAVEITVDFRWTDNRTGHTLLARRNFRAAGAFAPTLSVGERIETGQDGAIESLAAALVGELRSDW